MKSKIRNKIAFTVASVFCVLLLLFTSLSVGNGVSYAEASGEINYDSTYVMDDLKGTVIDGEPFNLYDYGFDKNKPLQIFSFVEYCYSFTATKQDNYGLYVYIYNPQGKDFLYDSVQNKIEFGVGENPEGFEKYPLQFLNCSVDTNFEGLFIKYKVILSGARKDSVLDGLNSTSRVYQVSGIELLIKGSINAIEYPATGVTDKNKTAGMLIYRYSGYSKGYGANPDANTLDCKSSKGDVLCLDVHHTSYCPDGAHADDYTIQDILSSVYFAVPKTYVFMYGFLSEIHAEWRDAVTSWGVVTGNRAAYDAVLDYVGIDIGRGIKSMEYGFGDQLSYTPGIRKFGTVYNIRKLGYCYVESWITQLNWLFYADGGMNSADHTTISSDELYDWYTTRFSEIVGKYYGSGTLECKDGLKIYDCLFDELGESIDDYHLSNDGDPFTLVAQKWSQNWWQRHNTGGHSRPEPAREMEGIEVIHEVSDAEVTDNISETCDNLLISAADYGDFKSFYDENKKDNVVYLCRFDKTTRRAFEASNCKAKYIAGVYDVDNMDTNAYFFKDPVYLDFDIIDVTFDNGTTKTVIPVVSSPIDIFPDVEPPAWTHEDKDPMPLWKKILYVILAVVAICILLRVLSIFVPIFKPVWNFIVKVITAPFRFIKWIFSKKE